MLIAVPPPAPTSVAPHCPQDVLSQRSSPSPAAQAISSPTSSGITSHFRNMILITSTLLHLTALIKPHFSVQNPDLFLSVHFPAMWRAEECSHKIHQCLSVSSKLSNLLIHFSSIYCASLILELNVFNKIMKLYITQSSSTNKSFRPLATPLIQSNHVSLYNKSCDVCNSISL